MAIAAIEPSRFVAFEGGWQRSNTIDEGRRWSKMFFGKENDVWKHPKKVSVDGKGWKGVPTWEEGRKRSRTRGNARQWVLTVGMATRKVDGRKGSRRRYETYTRYINVDGVQVGMIIRWKSNRLKRLDTDVNARKLSEAIEDDRKGWGRAPETFGIVPGRFAKVRGHLSQSRSGTVPCPVASDDSPRIAIEPYPWARNRTAIGSLRWPLARRRVSQEQRERYRDRLPGTLTASDVARPPPRLPVEPDARNSPPAAIGGPDGSHRGGRRLPVGCRIIRGE
eukprot:gene12584-biopygen12450